MQTAHCSWCGSKLPQPHQGLLTLRKSPHALRAPASLHCEGRKQKARHSRTLAQSHKEDNANNTKSGTDKPNSTSKRKQQDEADALREGMKARLLSSLQPQKQKLSAREQLEKEWKALVNLLPWEVGVPGSVALAAGLLLHLDPYGHLHWSSHDALVGLACAAPTALSDFGLMVPDFSDTVTRNRNVKRRRDPVADFNKAVREQSQGQTRAQDASQSEELRSKVADMAKSEEEKQRYLQAHADFMGSGQMELHSQLSAVKRSQDSQEDSEASKPSSSFRALEGVLTSSKGPGVLKESLKAWQRKAVLHNPGLEFLPPVEAAVILLAHLADEMLMRAILLAGLSGWVTDRLFEAGGEDLFPGLFSANLSVPDAGKCTALAILAGFEVGRAAAELSLPFRGSIKVQGMDRILGITKPAADIPTKKAQEKKKAEVMAMLKKVTKRLEKRRHGEVIVAAGRRVLALLSFGGSFILTGNLLAPYVGSVMCDCLFSTYQRAKHEQLVTKRNSQMTSMLEDWQAAQKARQQTMEVVKVRDSIDSGAESDSDD